MRETITLQVYDVRLRRWAHAHHRTATDANERELRRLRASSRKNGYRTRLVLGSLGSSIVLDSDRPPRRRRRRSSAS